MVPALVLAAPDIVLISVDTLRTDRLGCYGYALNTTPHLDAFAKECLLFENCVTEVPLTAPAFGAMMTSRYPRMNGAHRNGMPLPPDVPTLAEQFAAAGYETICVQSNWTLKAPLCGLARGFERYDDAFHKKRWGLLKSERYADEVTELALACLRERDRGRPLFAWFHYSDPHAPYRFHERFNPARRALWKMDKIAKTRARYDSEVAYTDHHIGRLLEALPRQNTFVVFVADHGESLYEHDYLGHGRRIYQDNVSIPLMLRGPGIVPGRSKAPARGIDLAPTLLGLAELPRPEGMLGLDLLRDEVPSDRARVIETYGGAIPNLPGAHSLMASRPPMRQGVLVGKWKLILDGSRAELYNLATDPWELEDLTRKQEARVAQLRAIIEEWDAATEKGAAEAAELSTEDIEALKGLGYVQ